MIIHAARHTFRVCLFIVGVMVILLALFTAVARLGLPMVANYKGTIEAGVSDYLKSPVDIGELSFSWEGAGPLLHAKNVAVLETPDRKVTLNDLLIDMNLAKSLLRGVPIINELTLMGASLAIEADADGQFRLHGMESVRTGGVATADSSQKVGPGVDVLAWLLNARKVGLLDTQLTLIDTRAGRTLVVEDLNIRAENVGDIHQLRIELKLPGELGGSLEAGIDLIGDADDIAQSDGKLYLRANQLQVKTLSEIPGLAQLLNLKRNAVAHLDTAVSLEMWGQWEDGRLVSANGPISTGAITDTDSGDVLLQGMSAMLGLSVQEDKTILNAGDLTLNADDGESRIDELSLSWQRKDPDSSLDWELDARDAQLSLKALTGLPASILSRLNPESEGVLKQAQPSGWLRDLDFNITQQGGVPNLSAHADIDQLTIAPVGDFPGFSSINGRMDIVELEGELSLTGDTMSLSWPGFFDDSVELDTLDAAVTFDARNSQHVLLEADIGLLDDGIETSTRLKATLVPGQSPHLDAQSQYSATDINAIKQWLPRRKLGESLSAWFDTSILGGAAKNGSLLFFGNISEFPFNESEGVFHSSVDLSEGRLSFLPDWPEVANLNGKLDLDSLQLTASAQMSRLGKFDITQSAVRINNLLKPVLQIETTGRGNLQDIIEFGNTGPLQSILEPVFTEVSGTGKADMDLALSVPLHQSDEPIDVSNPEALPLTLDGSVFFRDNTINLGLADMSLKKVNGAVKFDHEGNITINGLRARALDRAVIVRARTEGQGIDATTRIGITGALQGNEALAHYGSSLDQFLRGASSWDIELSAPHSADRLAQEGVTMELQSDLVGTELLLPVPFHKSSGKAVDFKLSTAFIDGGESQVWDVHYDNQLHVNALTTAEELESLLIHIGEGSLPEAWIDQREPGIRLQGSARTVAMDAWVDTLSTFIESIPEGEDGPSIIMPMLGELDIESLQVGERLLGPATLRVSSDETYVNAQIDNPSVSGLVQYPREHWTKEIEMKAEIEHLDSSLITALMSRVSEETVIDRTEELDPRRLPPVDAKISRLTHDGYTLRDLVIRAQPDVSGLNITTLGFAYQTMRLVGQGYWRVKDPQNVNPKLAGEQISQLNMVLQADDFGEGLTYIGMDDKISDGEGDIEVYLSWPGPLYSPELVELSGSIKMLIERGSIIPLEPGGGKMVGLFALQALPRRLELDFKDVTADGLAFERITGDIAIDKGVANAALVQLTGPIGVVDISGQSDIINQEFDQRITVLPRISAALPLIGLISAGATGGVGALVATGFLKAIGIDFDRLGLMDYSLTGKWDDPTFESVESDYWRKGS
ncbi:YhdP family protein [Granulosicoccus antarcticus]|uniref:YhdP central domain-containing protein n=1 Tax=Granulosicoccus antarcticus IMCC3135 TaxID=1192854 RepID=A0A2Z2P8E0_9GAMM|nr:YhdP family protein [Granulosicoccus antarcticus]ASJ76124.1 hypothetical protein IMCC3135_30375 [Granulosicoccus antarcticus IMCC3135]